MIYINEDTLTYPCASGDIALDPNASWAEVVEIEPPICEENEEPYQLAPEKIEGVWTQQWAIRELTPFQLEIKQGLHLTPQPILE